VTAVDVGEHVGLIAGKFVDDVDYDDDDDAAVAVVGSVTAVVVVVVVVVVAAVTVVVGYVIANEDENLAFGIFVCWIYFSIV
jgi:hypothetical protein